MQLRKSAKRTDLISSLAVRGSGLIVSEKLCQILTSFQEPSEYQIFDVGVAHKQNHLNYKYWHLHDDHVYLIDFSKMSITWVHKLGIRKQELRAENLEEYEKLSEEWGSLRVDKWILNKELVDKDIFWMSKPLGFCVTEKVKKALEQAAITGIRLVEFS